MRGAMNLNWKRPLLYYRLPLLIFLAIVGFAPPFAPPHAAKLGLEQFVPVDKKSSQPEP